MPLGDRAVLTNVWKIAVGRVNLYLLGSIVHALLGWPLWVALIVAAAIGHVGNARLLSFAGWSFVAGIVIFSGSLYALALTSTAILGAITPFGGLAFLIGWACLAFFAAAS